MCSKENKIISNRNFLIASLPISTFVERGKNSLRILSDAISSEFFLHGVDFAPDYKKLFNLGCNMYGVVEFLREYFFFLAGHSEENKKKVKDFISNLQSDSLDFFMSIKQIEQKEKEQEIVAGVWWTKDFQQKWEELFFFSNNEEEIISYLHDEEKRIKQLDEKKQAFQFYSFYVWCWIQKHTIKVALDDNTENNPNSVYFFLEGENNKQKKIVTAFDAFFDFLMSKPLKEIKTLVPQQKIAYRLFQLVFERIKQGEYMVPRQEVDIIEPTMRCQIVMRDARW